MLLWMEQICPVQEQIRLNFRSWSRRGYSEFWDKEMEMIKPISSDAQFDKIVAIGNKVNLFNKGKYD